jgi:hypothetical protein
MTDTDGLVAQARAAVASVPADKPWEVWFDHNAEAHVSQQGRRGFAQIADPAHGWPDYGLAIARFIADCPDLVRGLADEVERLSALLGERT